MFFVASALEPDLGAGAGAQSSLLRTRCPGEEGRRAINARLHQRSGGV